MSGRVVKTAEPDWPVLAFACLVAILLVLAAFTGERTGYVDELGLYNPSYMLAHYGNLTYPIYGTFDSIVTAHPPLHVGTVGLFAWLGCTCYYAEALPAFLWFLLAIVLIVRGPFASTLKLGLLFSIAYLFQLSGAGTGPAGSAFSARPEGHVQAAWLAGLILLECGRLENWRKRKLFAGGFAMAWASGVHYYAVAACLGVVVYALVAIRQKGWREAFPTVAAMTGGACLFGIPYVFLYLLPNRQAIADSVGASQQGGSMRMSMGIHWDLYKFWARRAVAFPPMQWAMSTGIPLMVFSTAILLAFRVTRVLALAALPIQLFVYLVASHKQGAYLSHEFSIFGLALAMGALALLQYVLSPDLKAGIQKALPSISVAMLSLYLLVGNRTLDDAYISLRPHMHEADVARAASRQLLAREPVVGSSLALWYASGGTYWYRMGDRWPIARREDIGRFFECFDGVAQGEFASAFPGSPGGESVSSLFADGSLKLMGFYLGFSDPELRFVLLHPHPSHRLAGYAARGQRLFRFDERPDGDREVISALCPVMPETDPSVWHWRWPATPSAVLHLPKPRPDGADNVVTVLTPLAAPEPAGQIGRSCRVFSRVRGAVQEVDKYALVDELRRADVPIKFEREIGDIPGCLLHMYGPSR